MFSRRCWVQFDTKEHAAAARDRLNGTRFESDVNFAEGLELLRAMQDTDEGKPKDGGDDDMSAGDTTAPSENGGAEASTAGDDGAAAGTGAGDADAGTSGGDGAATGSGAGDAASGEAGTAKPSSDGGSGDENGGADHSTSASPVDYQCITLEGPVPAVAPRQVKLNIKYRLRYYPRPLAPEASLPQAVHYNLRCVRDLATALDVEFGLVPAHAVRTIGAEGDTEPVRGGVQELLTLDTVRAPFGLCGMPWVRGSVLTAWFLVCSGASVVRGPAAELGSALPAPGALLLLLLLHPVQRPRGTHRLDWRWLSTHH